MKKRLPVIIGIVLTIVIAFLYGNTKKTHGIYDNNVNTAVYSGIGVLAEGETVTQTFICQEDKLDGFSIKSDVSGNYGAATVFLKVMNAETGEVLTEGQESGGNVKARKLHYYKVPTISDCKGKTLILQVSESNTTATDGVSLYYQPSSETGKLLVKNSSVSGTFVMKTVTERFDLETFAVMLFSEWFIWGFLWFLYRLFK
ncbi:hypothetical protein ACTQW9_01360 [Lachnospiraceae bacterium LCP19S3_B12]